MNFLTRVAATVAACFVVGTAAAEVPAFLILQEGVSFTDRAHSIEGAGVRIRHRVPPRILIVDMPDGTRANNLPGVQSAYLTALPVSSLESFGPTAVAAGLQWNRRVLSSAQASGAVSLGSMKQLLSDRSLVAPTNVRLTPVSNHLAVEWDGVDGATYYEIQASESRYFDGAILRTRSVRTRVEIARPGVGDIYVRVRAIDPGEATDEDDVNGRWSSEAHVGGAAAPMDGGTAPTLTSPANRLETEGFTLILEWTPSAGPARVQVAKDSSFTDMVFDEIVSGGEYACPGPALRTGDRLFWRVQSLDGARSPWSSSREARIGAPKPHAIDAFVNPEAPQ